MDGRTCESEPQPPGLVLAGKSLAGSSAEAWDAMYAGVAPRETGHPQPAIVGLARAGRLTGRVLDIGCGSGDNAFLGAAAGADVLGIDISPRSVARARARAAERRLPARFAVADALDLGALGETFDVVIDSGAFHVFEDEQRPAYVAGLATVTRPDARLYLLCFSHQTPGEFGPRRISRAELHDTFKDDWEVEAIEPSSFELPPGNPVSEAAAWLATIRRR